jgi:phosphoribosylformylglycinamidine synthase
MWGIPPALDMDYEKRVHQAMREIVAKGLVESAHDLSDGGLGVAIAECAFGGVGAKIEINWEIRPEFLLFHEGPSRILISTQNAEEIKKIATFFEVESPRIGVTMKERLQIRNGPITLVDCSLDTLRETWNQALERVLHPEHV